MTKHEDVPVTTRSAYAPLRFQATRPWWKLLSRLLGNHRLDEGKYVQGTLYPALQKEMRMRWGLLNAEDALQKGELMALSWFAAFLREGRVIYDFTPELSSVMALSPFEDSAVGDLTILEGTSYFHFGAVSELCGNGVQIEGAYATYNKEDKVLQICGMRSKAFDNLRIHYEDRDHIDTFHIPIFNPAQTLRAALEDTECALKTQYDKYSEQMTALLDFARNNIESFNARFHGPRIEREIQAGKPNPVGLNLRIASMVLGAYAFLASQPEDARHSWPADLPASRLHKLRAALSHPAKLDIAQKALDNDGYFRIRYVGEAFSQEFVETLERDTHTPTGKKKATHVRNYHWRNQACGPGHSLRRPVLVRRTIVNPGDVLPAGKIFETKESDG